ncbi:molybdopterin-dependent oxidoreductase [Promicromonospora kroppenstedtii]|uniref:Molybdopterin-dependent oxidoreductase n=2 Tax=Promicromonospora kroppenstedtii TaxID=440482 RepID=A0ABW7XPL0_9MICO
MIDKGMPAAGVPDAAGPAGRPVGRRIVLAMLGLGAAGVAVGPAVRSGLGEVRAALSRVAPAVVPDDRGFRYFSVVGSVPRKDATTYRLTVGGLVDRPATYTLDQLAALPQTTVVHDAVCTDGWQVDAVPFTGVLLRDLLDAAGVRDEGAAVRFTCFDGAYSESLTLEQARRSDVVVALRMFDEPVPHDSGGPVRLFVAPMYFYKSAKWLSGIEVTSQVQQGYWEDYGYPVDGWLPGEEPVGA